VTASVGNGATLQAAQDLGVSAFASSLPEANVEGKANGILTFGANSESIDVVNTATAKVGAGARIHAGRDLALESEAFVNVAASVHGGAGNTLSDFLKDLFSGHIGDAFNNLPSILSVGGSVAELTIRNTATTGIGSAAQVQADNHLTATALPILTVTTDTEMTSKGVIAASATALTDLLIISNGVVHFESGANVTGNALLHLNKVIGQVNIDNRSDLNLVIQKVQMISDNQGQPDIHYPVQERPRVPKDVGHDAQALRRPEPHRLGRHLHAADQQRHGAL
jgi:hypothetical protein